MTKPKKTLLTWTAIITMILGGGGSGAFVAAQKIVGDMAKEKVAEEVTRQNVPIKKDIVHLKKQSKKLEWDIASIKVLLTKGMSQEEIEKAEAKTNYLLGRTREK